MSENILTHAKSLYLYISITLVLVCYAIYLSQAGIEGANGGTPQGYLLGTVAAVLILWLTFLGARKRSFKSSVGSVKGWVSAHVYLGTSLILIASFHSDFQIGINVHTLTYGLLLMVIFSGFYGIYTYLRYPQMLSSLSNGRSRDDNMAVLQDITEGIEAICGQLDSELQITVISAIDRTFIGGTNQDILFGRDHSTMFNNVFEVDEISRADVVPNPDQQRIIEFVAKRMPRGSRSEEPKLLLQLLRLLIRRQQLLRNLRKSLQLKARTKIWLLLHIPLSIALLVALLIHIVSVFFYW